MTLDSLQHYLQDFKAKGVKVVGDNEPLAPGEFRDVEATGVDLNRAIVPLPYKEPSNTLYQMLGFISGAGQKSLQIAQKK